MSDDTVDPSMNTEAFRAFTERTEEPVAAPSSKLPLIIGGAVLAVIVVGVILWAVL